MPESRERRHMEIDSNSEYLARLVGTICTAPDENEESCDAHQE